MNWYWPELQVTCGSDSDHIIIIYICDPLVLTTLCYSSAEGPGPGVTFPYTAIWPWNQFHVHLRCTRLITHTCILNYSISSPIRWLAASTIRMEFSCHFSSSDNFTFAKSFHEVTHSKVLCWRNVRPPYLSRTIVLLLPAFHTGHILFSTQRWHCSCHRKVVEKVTFHWHKPVWTAHLSTWLRSISSCLSSSNWK